jgi:hypothetical protein
MTLSTANIATKRIGRHVVQRMTWINELIESHVGGSTDSTTDDVDKRID